MNIESELNDVIEQQERKEFEQWYVENAFDYVRDPIGSKLCADQWAAWKARAEKAEKELDAMRAMVFTNSDRSMTLKGRTFTVDDDGFICDQNFDFDAGMKVSGDFLDGEKKRYAEMIAEALNMAASNDQDKGREPHS